MLYHHNIYLIHFYWISIRYITSVYTPLFLLVLLFINLSTMFSISDHPVHPPIRAGDPFDLHFPDDLDYRFRTLEGMIHVYEDEVHVTNDQPIDLPYQNVETFLQDQALMTTIMSDGPL